MTQHSIIRTFYEEALRQFFIQSNFYQGITSFKPECLIGEVKIPDSFSNPELAVLNIAGEELPDDNDEDLPRLRGSIDDREGVPASVLAAFDRHLWYAQNSLSEISVLKIIINQMPTFALCINGYVDDGWDNSGEFIEIYDAQGALVGSAIVPTLEDDTWESWEWLNRPIQGDDFNTPAPEPEQGDRVAEQQAGASEQQDDLLLTQPAFMSTYQPPNPIIYVSNLAADVTEKDVTGLFAGYGTVKQTVLVKDAENENFALVEMTQAEPARTAIAELNGAKWRGIKLTIRSHY